MAALVFGKIFEYDRKIRQAIKIRTFLNKYRSMPIQAKAALWFLICSFLQKSVSMITTPIFTRLLSTDEYGEFNVFNSWMGIISIFVTLNLTGGVYEQGLIKYSDKRKIYASSLQGLTAVMMICWTVIYILFRGFWNSIFSLTAVQMLAMLVIIWSSAVFGFWAGEQRVEYKYRELVAVTICTSVLSPVLGIIFVTHSDDKATARILGVAVVNLTVYSVLFAIQMIRGKVFYSKTFWKYSLRFNLPLIPHYLSQTVLSNSDRIMIRDMAGESEAGIYGLAYSIALIMALFNTAIMQTISPWIYQKIKDRKEKDIAPVAYSTLILIAVVNLVLIILAPEIVAIFAPQEYYEAIWVIPPVSMSVFFIYIYDLFAKFAFYFEKTKFIMAASAAAAISNLILNYIFIPKFGYIAAGYTTLACYIIYSTCHYVFMRKVCRDNLNNADPYDLKVLLLISVVFLMTGFIFLFTYNIVWLRYGLAIILLAIAVIKHKTIVNFVKNLILIRNTDK